MELKERSRSCPPIKTTAGMMDEGRECGGRLYKY